MAEQCGCTVGQTLTKNSTVIYCPMHKAAPEMLAALEWAMAVIEDNFDASLDGGTLFHNARIEAIEAIAQARGQEVET